jgi:SAM-dependent methyltransferase
MHPEAREFVARYARPSPGLLVLDIGGRDMNGSARDLWPGADYTSMDIAAGPGVDVVADAAEWNPDWQPHEGFDVVVCCEVFEHAKAWPEIVATAYKALRPGGMFLVTCAGPNRAPHSGRRALPPEPDPDEHYANVYAGQLADVLYVTGFVDLAVDEVGEDVQAYARRPLPVHVVTGIYGAYDTKLLGMPAQERAIGQAWTPPTSFTLVTDDPTLGQGTTEYLPHLVYPEISHVATADGWEPKHAARWPKFCPAEAVPEVVAPGDVVIWVDGRFEITTDGYVAMMVEALGDADYAAWPHPSVTSMAAQVSACVREQPHKYERGQLIGHAGERAGAGETYDGMWQLTTMATRVNDRTMAAGRDVMDAMGKWPRSIDQIEFPYAAKRHGCRVADLPGGQGGFWDHNDTWFRLQPHSDGT